MAPNTPEPTPIPSCPRCRSAHVVRNGPNSAGTPTFRCRDCQRRFVAAPRKRPVTEELKQLVRNLLAERLALRAVARATGLSRSWLQAFVNDLYESATPHDPGPLKKRPARS